MRRQRARRRGPAVRQRAAQPCDTIGRLDGDKFVVICPVVSATEADGDRGPSARHASRTRSRSVATPCESRRASASPSPTARPPIPKSLLRDADHAMVQAKRDGRERAVLFSSSMRPRTSVGTHRAAAGRARRGPVPTRVPAGRLELRRVDRRRRSAPAVGPSVTSASFRRTSSSRSSRSPASSSTWARGCFARRAGRQRSGCTPSPSSALRVTVNVSARQLAEPDFRDDRRVRALPRRGCARRCSASS